jgi:hypothetical protein
MKKFIGTGCLLLTLLVSASAQGENGGLLSLLDEQYTRERVTNSFKSPRVVNSHSMEMLAPGTMDFRILHRFGDISQGYYELFGLDHATMRMGFDFGITPNLMVGFGRSTNKKELDGFVKYRLLWQTNGRRSIPFSLVLVGGTTVNGLKDPIGIEEVPVTFSRRLAYYGEIIIGRKFNDWLTLQVTPTIVHRNIVENRLETGGHVFQLHFSNATGMNERAYLCDHNGNWLKGEIRFGFNLSRVFQLVKQDIF